VQVRLKDGTGFLQHSGVNISIALNFGTGILSGQINQPTDSQGAVNFYDLSIDTPGIKTLSAVYSAGTPALSNNFTIRGVYHLSFAQIPTDTNADEPISPAVTVQLKDIDNKALQVVEWVKLSIFHCCPNVQI
jgi:hypothetical protein